MMMRLLLVLLLLFAGCARSTAPTPAADTRAEQQAAAKTEAQAESTPSRVILMIGDGMGSAMVTAAAYANGGPLHMMTMPGFAWNTTHEFEFVTTDSAASATALATGEKTHFEGVAVVPGTTAQNEEDPANHLRTLLDVARDKGWKTGLVATTRVVHATPAAFGAHRAHRGSYEEIALDLFEKGIDVMLGAGTDFFESRKDEQNLLELLAETHTIARTAEELRAAESGRIVGLLHPRDMPYVQTGERAMDLAELVEKAIEALDRDEPEGWVMMVEGSLIDWCGHEMDGACTIAETLDFDDAVASALHYARGRTDTLVVVTADHETGGMNVVDPRHTTRWMLPLGGEEAANRMAAYPDEEGNPMLDVSPPVVEHFAFGDRSATRKGEPVAGGGSWGLSATDDLRFTTAFAFMSVASRALWSGGPRSYNAIHTPVIVPVFAEGPGVDRIRSTRDNTDLGRVLHALLEETESSAASAAVDTRPKNVILMIGDGLGAASVTAGLYHQGNLAMMDMPVHGLVSTHASDGIVSDSAATATALASGQRTMIGAVGMAPAEGSLRAVESVVHRLLRGSARVGLVTNTSITHATPAAFYGQVESRREETRIAEQMAALAGIYGRPIDLAIGGGAKFFAEDVRQTLADQGVQIRQSWEPDGIELPALLLLAEDGLESATDRASSDDPTLAELTAFALDNLRSDDGFFLMVESGQIDWALHALRRDQGLLDEILEFDAAVAVALAYARQSRDTLVIVTSDHDHTMTIMDNHYGFHRGRCGAVDRCGGDHELIPLSVAVDRVHRGEGLQNEDLQGPEYAPVQFYLEYAWYVLAAAQRIKIAGPHSANFVPLFAYGPWSHTLEGYTDQPEIGRLLMQWAQ